MTSRHCRFENSVSRFIQWTPRARSSFIIWNFPIDWLPLVVSFTNKFVSVSYFSQLAPNTKVLSGKVDTVGFRSAIEPNRPILNEGPARSETLQRATTRIGRAERRKFWQLGARGRHMKIMSFLLHFLINYYSSFESAAYRRPYRFSYLARYRNLYIFERFASSLCAFEKYFTLYFLSSERTSSAVP